MKNQLIDLNNHLFLQLERINDEAIKPDQLRIEIERSKAITGIAKEIISNAQLALDAQVILNENKNMTAPAMISEQKLK